ncbi:UDP-3-O-(3-hydroxymyristoyl)glucosamine N-acyltransferase [Desulfonatronovibrio hydrogenovorans]|uniref:UDP-3-O-(3-hydroxymyristoyl)glucosamine N-acyltransferase n=1 Tax=Desulfonatronovibrio hydrogenovorans TaxID=53245 RepID=UPI00048D9756|nr:UDP-3-O-(3-hydroxymyristoyl)glucosamine N-acyltransferase [Desulfonatronovibrio hydrogenovorans]
MLLSELAQKLGLEFTGQDFLVQGVSTLDQAGPDQISFLANPKYVHLLEKSQAGAVILEKEHALKVRTALISPNPYLDFARTVKMFDRPQGLEQDCSSQAYIHESAFIDPSAIIHPMAFIGPGAVVGKNTRVFPFVHVGERAVIGQDCIIYPNVSIMSDTVIGNRVIIHSGAVIGSDGFGFVQNGQVREKIPQVGVAVIEDDVEIGACTTIDRATLGKTVVGRGTKIDNLVQVAHNVCIGENSVIVSQVGISGSSKLGRNVILGGQVGVAGHLEIGDNVRIAAKSGVGKSIPADTDCGGIPAMDHGSFLKNAVLMPRLPQMFKRVKKIENQLKTIQERLDQGEDR